jgi:uncharacterized protein YbcI
VVWCSLRVGIGTDYTGDIGTDIARASTSHDPDAHALGDLSRALVQLLHERGGRGPTQAKTHWVGDDALVVIFGDCFTQAEKTLWQAGAADAAERYRKTVQDVLAADMRSVVERATGRIVIADMGCAHHEPDLMAHIFMLEPPVPDSPA